MKEYKNIDLKYISDTAQSLYLMAKSILSEKDAGIIKIYYIFKMNEAINKKGGVIKTDEVESKILEYINEKFQTTLDLMIKAEEKENNNDEEVVYAGPKDQGGYPLNSNHNG